jgi:cell division protein FtsW
MKGKDSLENKKGPLWAMLQKVEGDKVILIIVLLLLLVSFLAIFSSTPMLPAQESRLKTMTEHGIVALLGIGVMFVLYHIRVQWLKPFARLGFIFSVILLSMLLFEVNIPGIIKTQNLNGAVRNFSVAGLQIHVFEVVKVAMIMYLAWAMNAVKDDLTGVKKGRLKLAEKMSGWHKRLAFLNKPFGKRAIYIYAPTMIVSLMVFAGSGSSAIFICAILVAAMLLGETPIRELLIAGAVIFVGFFSLVTIYKVSDGKVMGRVGTMISRMNADYDIERLEGLEGDAYHNMVDTLSQPVSAKIAVHEGGLLGKGIGNSTQKYRVQNIYGDYMYSFIIEEYGLIGGLAILILYVSLLARSSIIARMCSDDFAKFALGGLSLLITGQAFMHILVNVDIGPMTGQTLPLISHGASAFLVFCVAFGVILSISRMAKKKIQTVEEAVADDKNALQDTIEKAAKSK